MRTKMRCTTVIKDKANHEIVGLTALTSADSAAHADSQVSLRIPVEKDHGHFEPGKDYYVDFVEVEQPKAG